MGACAFEEKGRGKSARDVFTRLQQEAERQLGDDPYNGTISTVSGFTDVTIQWKNSKKDLNKFIDEKLDNASKRDCFCICIKPPVENTNKIKSQVEHFVDKGTKKWITKYVVETYDGVLSSHDTKGDAVKAARAYTEKNLSPSTVYVRKSLEKGNSLLARITYKRSTTEKDGEWIFFGYAAE